MEPPILWHELLGLICTDFLADSPFAVEAEKDLSRKKQLLDLVIVRTSEAPFSGRLPDGLDNLARHNLITFKSFQETLDIWAMKELLAHSVNYVRHEARLWNEGTGLTDGSVPPPPVQADGEPLGRSCRRMVAGGEIAVPEMYP